MEERRGRGQLGRALEGFANAVIERALPRVRTLLAARLGSRAELDSLELDGARVHLVDLRLPLGPRASLHASRATFLTRTEDLVAGLPAIRLERLEGTLVVPNAHGASLRARVTLDTAAVPSADAWVDGTLSLRDMVIAGVRYDGSARVRVSSTRFSVEDARLVRESALAGGAAEQLASEAEVEGDAGGAFVSGSFALEHAHARIASTPLAVFEELASALGGTPVHRLPIDASARVSGRARLERDRRATGALSIVGRAGDAELSLEGRAIPGGLEARIDARVDPALVHVAGFAASGAPLVFRGTIGESMRRPRIALEGRSDELAVAAENASDVDEPITLRRTRVVVELDDRGMRIDARARHGRGAIHLSRAPSGEARVELERVEVAPFFALLAAHASTDRTRGMLEELGLDRGHAWADLIYASGALSGKAHVEAERARLTLDPARFDVDRRALDGSVARVGVAAVALARALPSVALRPSSGELELDVTIDRASLAAGGLSHASAHGSMRAARLGLALRDREVVLTELGARLALEGGALHLTSAHARVLGGRARGAATIAWRERPRVLVTELALEGLRDRRLVAALIDRDVPEVAIDAALERRDGALRGTVSVRTDQSTFSARTRIGDEGAIHGTEVECDLAMADLAWLVERWTLRPELDARWTMKGTVEGSLRSPRAELEARCDRQRVHLIGDRARVELDAHDVSTRLRITRSRVSWSAMEARGYGGVLRSRGTLVTSTRTLSGHLDVEGVDAGRLPLVGGETLATRLEGTLSGALDLFRPNEGPTVGRGHVRVDAPIYRVIDRGVALAKKLELPLPDARGLEPLTAIVRLTPVGWRASELSARLSGLSVRGHVFVHRAGSIEGRLVLRPEPSWLRASRVLAPIAELVTDVPIDVGGSLATPHFRADALGAADGVLARSSLGRHVRSLLESLAPEAFARRPAGAHAATRLLSTDALLDRLARDPSDADEVFDVLLERGLDPEEIAAAVARRRAGE